MRRDAQMSNNNLCARYYISQFNFGKTVLNNFVGQRRFSILFSYAKQLPDVVRLSNRCFAATNVKLFGSILDVKLISYERLVDTDSIEQTKIVIQQRLYPMIGSILFELEWKRFLQKPN